MADQNEVLTRLLKKFVTELLEKLPKIEQNEIRDELAGLEARIIRLEEALDRLGQEGVGPRGARRVKRVTLKDRVVRLVNSRPDGIRTSQIARVLSVAQANVSHALRQATEENLIVKEKRGLYRPKSA